MGKVVACTAGMCRIRTGSREGSALSCMVERRMQDDKYKLFGQEVGEGVVRWGAPKGEDNRDELAVHRLGNCGMCA